MQILAEQDRLRAADQRDTLVIMNLAFRGGRDAEATLAELRRRAEPQA